MIVGIVIPTYNRLPNLRLALEVLSRQTMQDFYVVVADSGSTDGTRDAVEQLAHEPQWREKLRWVGCGKHEGYRVARTKNIGVANLPDECSLLVSMDSDVLLESTALEIYATIHTRHPEALIVGGLDWLPPLSHAEIRTVIERHGLEGLRQRVPTTPPQRVEGTTVGPDGRPFSLDTDAVRPFRVKWALINNVGIPLQIFHALGGFDEGMVGYGFDDSELGMRAVKQNIPCLLLKQLWGVHIWHPKPAPPDRLLESQRNLDYVLRKHGPIEDLEDDIDWSYWRHYHQERGGRVVEVEQELWAVSISGSQRLRLPDRSWIRRLGHCPDSIIRADMVPDFAHIRIAGAASERI